MIFRFLQSIMLPSLLMSLSSIPFSGGDLLLGQSRKKNTSVYPKGMGGDRPAWVAFDRQVRLGGL